MFPQADPGLFLKRLPAPGFFSVPAPDQAEHQFIDPDGRRLSGPGLGKRGDGPVGRTVAVIEQGGGHPAPAGDGGDRGDIDDRPARNSFHQRQEVAVEQPLGGQRRRDLQIPLAGIVGKVIAAVHHRHAAPFDIIDEEVEAAESLPDVLFAQVDRHRQDRGALLLKLLDHLAV